MADVTAAYWTVNPGMGAAYKPTVVVYQQVTDTFTPQTAGIVRRIQMCWLDVDALPTVTYRTWFVVDIPDPTGLYYRGTKTGATAITGAFVVNRSDT